MGETKKNFKKKDKENECVRGKLIVHGRKCVQTKNHGRKLCVTNNCSGVHEMTSMNKPLDSLLK